MVGNDIVDLRDPDSDATSYRSRFDERVFSPSERRSIDRAPSSEHQRWRLWAAKEASYKLVRKYDSSTVFSPRAFAVDCDEDNTTNSAQAPTQVQHDKLTCFVEFDETPERIHAIAVPAPNDFALVLWGIDTIDSAATSDCESRAVRDLACDAISRRFDYSRDQLEIRKTAHRIPRLYYRQGQLDLSVSLSHHGSWLAFACCTGEGRGA